VRTAGRKWLCHKDCITAHQSLHVHNFVFTLIISLRRFHLLVRQHCGMILRSSNY